MCDSSSSVQSHLSPYSLFVSPFFVCFLRRIVAQCFRGLPHVDSTLDEFLSCWVTTAVQTYTHPHILYSALRRFSE